MNQKHDQLEALHEIRDIMDRSSRFISLSGLSGIFTGFSALAGAGVVKWYLIRHNITYFDDLNRDLTSNNVVFLVLVAASILIIAFCSALYFTMHNARIKQQRIWDSQSKRWLTNLAIPLATGGIFCAILLYHQILFLIAPAMLIFYGLSLINVSKYSVKDLRTLGIFEIILGLTASVFTGHGLILWTVGFGILHIVYGALLYFKYER